ncbi:hypothetical protein ACIP4Q_07390 [Streptomyces massasporeus]
MLPVEQPLVGLKLRGQQVQAAVTVFADEARRRCAAGLGAVDNRALLTVLHDLPVDLPVRLTALDARALRMLYAAPSGVVDLAHVQGVAVRRLVPAVHVTSVLVHGPNGIARHAWDAAVRDASQFAPFCARGVVVSHPVQEAGRHEPRALGDPDTERLLLKARFYGVGVATQEPTGLRWLLEPAPFRPQRHSAAQWLFHEQAWRQMGPTRSCPGRSSALGNATGLGRRQA